MTITRARYDEACSALRAPPDATEAQLKTCWRDLAQKHHPDRGGDAPAFNRARDAWELVTEARYRRPPAPVFQGGSHIPFGGLSAFFRPRQATPDVTFQRIAATFGQIVSGAQLPLTLPAWIACPTSDTYPHADGCRCRGTGWIREGDKTVLVNLPPGVGWDGSPEGGPRPTQLAFAGLGPPHPRNPGEVRSARSPAVLEVTWDQKLPDVSVEGATLHGARPVQISGHDVLLDLLVDITQVLLGETLIIHLPWETDPLPVPLDNLLAEGVRVLDGVGTPILNTGKRGDVQIVFTVNTRIRGKRQREALHVLRDLRINGASSGRTPPGPASSPKTPPESASASKDAPSPEASASQSVASPPETSASPPGSASHEG